MIVTILITAISITFSYLLIHFVYEQGRRHERALQRQRKKSNAGFKNWEAAFDADGFLTRSVVGRFGR